MILAWKRTGEARAPAVSSSPRPLTPLRSRSATAVAAPRPSAVICSRKPARSRAARWRSRSTLACSPESNAPSAPAPASGLPRPGPPAADWPCSRSQSLERAAGPIGGSRLVSEMHERRRLISPAVKVSDPCRVEVSSVWMGVHSVSHRPGKEAGSRARSPRAQSMRVQSAGCSSSGCRRCRATRRAESAGSAGSTRRRRTSSSRRSSAAAARWAAAVRRARKRKAVARGAW